MKRRQALALLIGISPIIFSCSNNLPEEATIPAYPNYFRDRPREFSKGKLEGKTCFADTLNEEEIYIIPKKDFQISLTNSYDKLKRIKIQKIGRDVYEIKELIYE